MTAGALLGTSMVVASATSLPSDVEGWMAPAFEAVYSQHIMWPYRDGEMHLDAPLTRYQAMFAFAKQQQEIKTLTQQVQALQSQVSGGVSAGSSANNAGLQAGASASGANTGSLESLSDAVITVAADTITKTGMLDVQYPNGDESIGSAFFVNDNLHLLTDNHVIAPESAGNSSISPARITFTLGSNTYHVTVVKSDTASDLALLELDHPATGVTPLVLNSSVQIGESILTVGSPLGLYDTVSKGIVSQRITYNGQQYIQLDAGVNKGNSGGPVVAMNGQVIGIVDFKWDEGTTGLSDNIAEATPVSTIQQFLK